MEILRVILGSTGLIGSAWQRYQPTSVIVDRTIIENWFSDQATDSLGNFFEDLPKDREIELHFCFGNTNSTENLDRLMQINCHWPLLIARQALMRNFRIVTYGSALEIFGIRNNYFETKRAFAAELGKLESRNRWTNVHLHTLYSDSRPRPHMFLGQIYSALQNSSSFSMTSGKQLREFHHVDDDIRIIESALRSNFNPNLEISHGRPTELVQVAKYLFDSFNLGQLLRVNSYPDNPNDNYTKIFLANPIQGGVSHREPLSTLQSIFARLLEEGKVVE
jgi:nucleoside-diphosphate-sugar epimerase